jgi:nucleoside-diphosphate-sugar epimerase
MTEQKKNILVTGAGGFLGYHMANYLHDRGHKVDGMDLHFHDLSPDGTPARFNTIEEDFRNWQSTEEILQGKDIVYHFASAHLQISLDESEYWDVNVHGLKLLLEKAHQSGCKRFIHVSSVGAYGKLAEIPATETTVCHPQSIYGETKLAGEKEVREFCGQVGMPFVILRPAWIYGLGCPRTAKLQRMLKKRRFVMIGAGLNKRHPMYIKDMLTAFKLAMEKDKALGETMIIGGDQIITTRELVDTFSAVLKIPGPVVNLPYSVGVAIASVAEAVFGIIGKEPPISRRTLEFFDTDNGFDVSKSKEILGFSPAYTFVQGVEDYARVISTQQNG